MAAVMALSDRFRKVFDAAATRAVDALSARGQGVALAGGPRELSLSASIPNPFGGEPLAQLRMHLSSERQAHGESLRLRAHLKTQFEMPETHRPALAAPGTSVASSRSLAPRAQRAAQTLVRRGLETGLAKRLTPYLERRFESWVDIQASTTPLDQGAQALVPDSMQVLGLGRAPTMRLGDDGQIETWVGRCTGDHPGMAQVTLLQFSEPSGRTGKRRIRTTRKPLNVAASLASFYEDAPKRTR
jgi:hypothetical protein